MWCWIFHSKYRIKLGKMYTYNIHSDREYYQQFIYCKKCKEPPLKPNIRYYDPDIIEKQKLAEIITEFIHK